MVNLCPPALPLEVLQGFDRLTEATSRNLASQIQTIPVATPLQEDPITTAFVRSGSPAPAQAPLVLIHGFDSSLLEFRRLIPHLAPHREVWVVDLLGFGFTDRPPQIAYSPAAIQAHLQAFWHQVIQRPMVLVGASMGGTAAMEFALACPEAVENLVLLDSAGVKSGPVLGKYLFPPLDAWAVEFLRQPGVRRSISRSAYYAPDRWVTPDAELCAALHLSMPHWHLALKSFTKSGGYGSVASRLGHLQPPTLIFWGRQDRILGTQDATYLANAIPQAQLVWIENSGHVPHLEQAEAVATALLQKLA